MGPVKKSGTLFQAFALRVKESIPEASSGVFKRPQGFTKWNVVRVLAIGALMSAGVAIYFNMASEGAAGASTKEKNLEARPVNDGSSNRADDLLGDEGGNVVQNNQPLIIGEYDDNLVFVPSRWEVPNTEVPNVPTGEVFPTAEELDIFMEDDSWRFGLPYYEEFGAYGLNH